MSIKIDEVRNGTIYITGDMPIEYLGRAVEKELPEDGGILFVSKTNIEGIYTYGLEQTKHSYFGHKPGYIWSSRASVINAAFDYVLYEACYRSDESRSYCSCAVDLVRFEQLLKDSGYEVDFTPHVSADKIDTHYNIRLKG